MGMKKYPATCFILECDCSDTCYISGYCFATVQSDEDNERIKKKAYDAGWTCINGKWYAPGHALGEGEE